LSGLGGVSIGHHVRVVDGRFGGAHSGACDVRGEGGSDVYVMECLLVCGRHVGGVRDAEPGLYRGGS
jgi:hypothetical protein